MQFIDVDKFMADVLNDEHLGGKMFSWNPACSCHEDEILIYWVNLWVQDGLMTPDEATDFVMGKGI